MTIAKAINGDTFVCMMCRKEMPIADGVRRSLNEFVDVFHCVKCVSVSEKEVKSQVLHGLSITEDPAVEKMIDEMAHKAVAMVMAKKRDLN